MEPSCLAGLPVSFRRDQAARGNAGPIVVLNVCFATHYDDYLTYLVSAVVRRHVEGSLRAFEGRRRSGRVARSQDGSIRHID